MGKNGRDFWDKGKHSSTTACTKANTFLMCYSGRHFIDIYMQKELSIENFPYRATLHQYIYTGENLLVKDIRAEPEKN